jgi:hypothetical protein
MALSILVGLASIMTTKAQDQFLLAWNATGYTYNSRGELVATNVNAQTLIKKVAADNGLDPKDLAFVYRVENLDTGVAFKTNGQFVADVYQMEDTFTAVTNAAGTMDARQSLLTIENATNYDGALVTMGGIFGIEDFHHDASGNLISYSYHGNFNYSLPGETVVFSGTFSTGARLKLLTGDDVESNPPKGKKAGK